MKVLKTLVVIIMMTVAMPVFAQFTTGGKSNGISSSENYLHTGYKGMVDAGYGIGVGDFGVDRIIVTTSHGYQFCPYFFAGVGTGINYYHDSDAWGVPIFANLRGSLPISNTKFAPFLDMKIGYSVADAEGFFFSPSIGTRIATSNRCGLNIGLGYEMQKRDAYITKITCGAFAIKIGLDF